MAEEQTLIDADDVSALKLLKYGKGPTSAEPSRVSIDVDPNHLLQIPFSIKRGVPRIEVCASSRKTALKELASELGGYSAYLFDLQAAVEAIAASLPDDDQK